MTIGLPGSGKSTWAKELMDKYPNSYKRINKDDLRSMLDNNFHSNDAEKFILNVRDTLILLALESGKNVIIDDTNFAPTHERRIRELIKGKAELEIKDFTDVPIETCIERDLKRLNSVGEKAIRTMYNKYLKKEIVTEQIKHVKGVPTIVICDLDGTLAILNGRNPYDATTCENDILNKAVASVIKNKKVILLSGREDRYINQTRNFLEKHDIKYLKLILKNTGDNRKDTIVKKELYNEHIKGKYNVEFVLEDRSQMVQMWREMGLQCWQVCDGNY